MTTCAEWADELAALRAAETTYLAGGGVTMMQYGDKKMQMREWNYNHLLARIRLVQAQVDICNGDVRRPGRSIVFVPSDS